MGLFDRLKRAAKSRSDEGDDLDPLADLTLDKLKPGYLVDYDYTTWTVKKHVQYDFEGFLTDEWHLESENGTIFLELEDDDGPNWSVSREIPLTALKHEGSLPLARYIAQHDDAPDEVTYQGTAYELVESGPAQLIDEDGSRHPLVYWIFAADDDTFVAIEQYGEESFDASAGSSVEPYEFDNILPGTVDS